MGSKLYGSTLGPGGLPSAHQMGSDCEFLRNPVQTNFLHPDSLILL